MSTGVIGSKPTLMPVFLEETAPVVAKESGKLAKERRSLITSSKQGNAG